MKLVDKKIRKDPPTSATSAVVSTSGGVKKTPPASPTKSVTRTSLRQQHKPPESGPLPGSWERFDSKIKIESGETWSETTSHFTPEGVVCRKRWRYRAGSGQRELWGYHAERGTHHFYPGQIIRAMDAQPQCDLNASLDNGNTNTHKDGPVIVKKRPMVVLCKTHSAVLCLPMRSLDGSKAMETYPERWHEYLSSTTEDDASWEGHTAHAGPPLIYTPNLNLKDDRLAGRCYISLTSPTLVNVGSEIDMNLGRLSGSALCRLIQAYTYSQNQHKKKMFAEFGETAELPDPDTWWASKDPLWRMREARMNNKVPVVVDKVTRTYKLE